MRKREMEGEKWSSIFVIAKGSREDQDLFRCFLPTLLRFQASLSCVCMCACLCVSMRSDTRT